VRYGCLEKYYLGGIFCCKIIFESEDITWRYLPDDLFYTTIKKGVDKYYKNLYNKQTRK
jgi:hypothetical protein